MSEHSTRIRTANQSRPAARAIALANGMAVIVDEEDFLNASSHCWHAHKGAATWYARGRVGGLRIMMHVWLMGCRDGMTVDHVNGHGLDNRRCNLRHATATEQAWNIHVGRGRSPYKGVSWARRQRKWAACIAVDSKNRHIGYFDNEDDAARAYDAAARRLHGAFASLNFPEAA